MSKLTGLFRRGSSYYIRIVLPESHPLRATFTSGRVVKALGCLGRHEADLKGALLRIEMLHGVGQSRIPALVVAPAQPLAPPAIHLRTVYQQWCEARPLTQDTKNACGRAVTLYEKRLDNRPVQLVTRADGVEFRKWLSAQRTSSKTAKDRMTWVRLLLKFAAQDMEVIPKNPWEGLEVSSHVTTPRLPWSAAEVKALLADPIWQRGALPKVKIAGGPAAYWIPLLAMYSGARCSEICQLLPSDIMQVDGVHVIRISDSADGQRVKTNAARRIVPLHSELIRLGFLEYVAAGDHGSLWPELPKREGKPGGFFSQYFGRLKQAHGVRKQVVLHSFRHNVRSALADAQIPESVIDRLMGHECGGSVGARVYTHVPLHTLQSAIERLRYSGIQLPPVFKQS